MHRIVGPSGITFVDRNRGSSFLLFLASLVALLMAASAREAGTDRTARELGGFALAGSGALFLAAFWLLFRKRAFVIDAGRRTLTVLDRRLLGLKTVTCPLDQVRVGVEQKHLMHQYRGMTREEWVGHIWIELGDGRRIPFMDEVRASEAQALGTRLAQDLGAPIDLRNRDDW